VVNRRETVAELVAEDDRLFKIEQLDPADRTHSRYEFGAVRNGVQVAPADSRRECPDQNFSPMGSWDRCLDQFEGASAHDNGSHRHR
jgi:hypothetical protein